MKRHRISTNADPHPMHNRERGPGQKLHDGPRHFNHMHGTGWKKRSKLDVKAAAEVIHTAFPGDEQPGCEFMSRLRGSKKSGVALLHEIVTYPGYVPERTAIHALAATCDQWTGKALLDTQNFWVDEILKYPFARLGGAMAEMIVERGDKLVPEVWPRLIAWFAGHRSPRQFFQRAAVIEKVPNTPEATAALAALPYDRFVPQGSPALVGGRQV